MLHMNIRLLFLLILTISCNENYYNEYAVVSATKEATNAGIRILEQGGNAFDYLDAPVKRVNGADVPMPYAPNLIDAYLPNPKRVIEAVKAAMYIS